MKKNSTPYVGFHRDGLKAIEKWADATSGLEDTLELHLDKEEVQNLYKVYTILMDKKILHFFVGASLRKTLRRGMVWGWVQMLWFIVVSTLLIRHFVLQS